MDELIECEGCRRHVRRTDARCPFCGGRVSARARPASRILGRVTRAAIFYGASTLGCAEAPSATPAESVVAPPMQPVSVESVEASASDQEAAEALEPLPAPVIEPDTPEEARMERADAEERKRRQRTTHVIRQVRPPPPPCCPAPPYGAPPFDFAV